MMELEDVETEHQMDHRVHFQKYLDERTCYFHLHSVHIFWLRKQNFKGKSKDICQLIACYCTFIQEWKQMLDKWQVAKTVLVRLVGKWW